MSKRKSKTGREKQWTEFIEQARSNAAGVAEYCREKNVSLNTYYSWFKKLRRNHPEWKDLKTPPSVRAKAKSNEARPAIEVIEKAKRRTFTVAYKAKILRETEEAPQGQVAAILRREGLYTSHLQKWRLERDERALAPQKRGPKADPLAAKYKQLVKENEKLKKQLAQANDIIDVQKKIARILDGTLQETSEDE